MEEALRNGVRDHWQNGTYACLTPQFTELLLTCWSITKLSSSLNSEHPGSMTATWTYIDFTSSSSRSPDHLHSSPWKERIHLQPTPSIYIMGLTNPSWPSQRPSFTWQTQMRTVLNVLPFINLSLVPLQHNLGCSLSPWPRLQSLLCSDKCFLFFITG